MLIQDTDKKQAPVVQKVDYSAIQRINHYRVDRYSDLSGPTCSKKVDGAVQRTDSAIGFPNIYPLDSDLLYPVDSAIQLLNNGGLLGSVMGRITSK